MEVSNIITILLCNLVIAPLAPWLQKFSTLSPLYAPTTLHISASHHLDVSANRAVISIHVKSEGANQDSVSEEIKTSQNEIMSLLKPLTELPANISQPYGSSQTVLLDPPERAIVHLGVNAFAANSHRKRQTLLGEKPLYEASASYEAEFADFDAMGDVVAKLTRMSRVKIESVKWKLSDAAREEAIAQCQREAARILMIKARSTVKPMGLERIRVIEVNERNTHHDWEINPYQIAYMDSAHDEVDGRLRRSVRDPAEVQFEPKTLGYEIHLKGTLEAS